MTQSTVPGGMQKYTDAGAALVVLTDSAGNLVFGGAGGGVSPSIAENLIIDSAGIYWTVRDIYDGVSTFTRSYINLATGIAGTPTAPVTPASIDRGKRVVQDAFDATGAGSGYAIGDKLERIVVLNTTIIPPTVDTAVWVNMTAGTIISAPTGGTFQETDQNVKVSSTDIGSQADSPAASDSAAATLIALIKRLNGKFGDVAASGSITTQNLNATGAGTAGSFVGFTNLSGRSTVAFQVTGTYTGALTPQVTLDGTNWVTLGGVPLLNVNTGAYSATIASAATGIFTVDVTGFANFRLVALAAVTGSAVVTMDAANAAQMVALDNPIPTGTNSIGTVILGTGAAAIGSLAAGTANIGSVSLQAAIVADVASAALTASGASTAIALTNMQSASFGIFVTVVAGTTPTYDAQLQFSYDGGTTYEGVYDFDRITTTGVYKTPLLNLEGATHYRINQTVGGTTPSFTRSIQRMPRHVQGVRQRKLVDRSIVPTTLNSATPWLTVDGCQNINAVVSLGAATTPPAYQLQGSEDGGTNIYNIGAPFTPSASTTQLQQYSNAQAKQVRLVISTAGVSVTQNYVSIKAL